MQRVQRCCYDRAAQTIVAPTLVMDDHNPAVILQGYDKMCAMKTLFYHSLHKCPENVS